MRHKRSGFKLKRDAGSRKALLKGLVTSVIEHERVVTTVTKAKAVRPLVEKMITLAKGIRCTPAVRPLHFSKHRPPLRNCSISWALGSVSATAATLASSA